MSGLVIGLLGGLVGLILGALRMPALLKLVGEAPARAVGTNLAVGVVVGMAGLLGHLPTAAPDWGLLAVGAAASVPGALLGARLTGRLSEVQLVRAIGVVAARGGGLLRRRGRVSSRAEVCGRRRLPPGSRPDSQGSPQGPARDGRPGRIGPIGPSLACPPRSPERRATLLATCLAIGPLAMALAGTSVTGGRLNAARALRQAAKVR